MGSGGKHRQLVLVIALGVLVPSLARPAPPPPSPAVAAEQINQVLEQFSAALASADEKTLRELATPQFALIDEGRTYDIDALVESVKGVLATGKMTRRPESAVIQIR